jgi:hypothetical protein
MSLILTKIVGKSGSPKVGKNITLLCFFLPDFRTLPTYGLVFTRTFFRPHPFPNTQTNFISQHHFSNNLKISPLFSGTPFESLLAALQAFLQHYY